MKKTTLENEKHVYATKVELPLSPKNNWGGYGGKLPKKIKKVINFLCQIPDDEKKALKFLGKYKREYLVKAAKEVGFLHTPPNLDRYLTREEQVEAGISVDWSKWIS